MASGGVGRACLILIRKASAHDHDAVWSIIEPIIRAGETYALDPDMARSDALAYWCDQPEACFVAEAEGRVVGTYYLRTNQGGGGRHVVNCGYMVSGDASGRGVASAMCEHSLEEAQARGYRAMQFNFVVASNAVAIRLWQRFGFAIVGTLPKAFEHPSEGLVDALVMHRVL